MKRIRVHILSLFTLVATALPAQAAHASADDSTRLYIGAQLGDSVIGGILGLQINKSFSVEARYDYIETVDQPNTTVDAYCVGLTGIGMYPVKFGKMAPFFLFMKAGYEQTTKETAVYDPGIPGIFPATTTVTTTDKKRVVVGAGVHYDFSRDVSGRIGVNAVGSDHSVYLTAIYKF